MAQMIEKRGEPLKQFCASMGFSYDTGLRAVKAGTLRSVRVGKLIIIPADEIERVGREGLTTRRGAGEDAQRNPMKRSRPHEAALGPVGR